MSDSSNKKLGARKDKKYIIICEVPSVNWTRVGDKTVPVPYNISQTLDISEHTSSNVYFNGNEAFIWNSMTPTCKGDERGTKKGVKSDTQGWICEPLKDTGAKTVLINGKRVIRVGDKFKMNKASKDNR